MFAFVKKEASPRRDFERDDRACAAECSDLLRLFRFITDLLFSIYYVIDD